jgi:O-acetyl-ADP-ribose deacetylase (regulator of RNase III)
LEQTWDNVIAEVNDYRLHSIATGGISNGAYAFPLDLAAKTMIGQWSAAKLHGRVKVTVFTYTEAWHKAVKAELHAMERAVKRQKHH